MKKILFVFLFALISMTALAQLNTREGKAYSLTKYQPTFFFDAIVFKSAQENKARIDIYAMIPYQTLNFIETGTAFGAEYELQISIFDSSETLVYSDKIERKLIAKEYFEAMGGSAKFDYVQKKIDIYKGTYRIKLDLIDISNKQEYTKSSQVIAPNFYDYPFALSGIMLINSIEENAGKYTITPHLDDNISMLKEGWFIFFESYNKLAPATADFEYSILDESDKEIANGKSQDNTIKLGRNQHYLHVKYPNGLFAGQYTLRLKATSTNDSAITKVNAISSRTILNKPAFGSYVLEDLEQAIEQLVYVADRNDIKYIRAAETEAEKRQRFDDFWKTHDPSPTTDRNEAFDEYYLRISYANDNFKSYAKGWRSDQGHVYVVYGPPYQIETIEANTSEVHQYERWSYNNNYQFLFADKNGFRDFRLVRPVAVSDQYTYKMP